MGGHVDAGERAMFDVNIRDRFAANGALFLERDIAAHILQHFEQAGAGRIDADILDDDIRPGDDQCRDHQKGSRGWIARHLDLLRLQLCFAGQRYHPAAIRVHSHADLCTESLEHRLAMIAGQDGFDDPGNARRIEAGQQNG